MRPLALCLSLCLTFALPALAADGIREERVHFKAGTSGTTVKGHCAAGRTWTTSSGPRPDSR